MNTRCCVKAAACLTSFFHQQASRLLFTNTFEDCHMGAQSTLRCLTASENDSPPGSYYHNVFGVTPYHPTLQYNKMVCGIMICGNCQLSYVMIGIVERCFRNKVGGCNHKQE